jgi:hypothetical protein
MSERQTLSSGLFGHTYLVENGEYVIKQQRYLDNDTNFAKELKVYQWVESLPWNLRLLFCRLLTYRVIKPCDLPRRHTSFLHGSRLQQIRQLNSAPKCVEMLLENKGLPLDTWLRHNMPRTTQQVFYIMRLLTALHMTMFTAGYLHNDLHFENVLVGKTSLKVDKASIKWDKRKYSFVIHRNQVMTAIDYGEVTVIRQNQAQAQARLLDDILESLADLLLKRYAYNNQTDIAGERRLDKDHRSTIIVFPPRIIRGIRKVIDSYPDVYAKARDNAIEIDPSYKQVFHHIEQNKLSNPDDKIRKAIRHIQHELQLTHPEVFARLFDKTTFYKRTLLPIHQVRTIMACRSITQLLDLIF